MNRTTKNRTSKSPVVGKYLDVSTAHITTADAKLLDLCGGANPFVVYKYPEGYFVHVSIEDKYFHQTIAEARKAGYSKAFIAIMRWAWSKSCWFVRLDCDGFTYSDLPTYEW
jgi:hypothetical protein